MPTFHDAVHQDIFDQHIRNIDNLLASITPTAPQSDLRELEQIKTHFQLKIDDFYRSDRKLNIGVIGQVKSGKSSFLNTLLFGGQAVLPKASTPKTATLTKIEYSPTNQMEIEYYSLLEWETLEENAKIELDDEIYTSSRELLELAENANVDIHSLLAEGKKTITFDSYDALVGTLNEYVGENGRYTALVKCVTLYLNREELRGISIVDTPGLNDPIVSRTIRTKEFIELCDIVFFLSQTSHFLDESDWNLLSTQLPQKGAKKLVLVGSKLDSALRDILRPATVGDDIFDTLDDDDSTDDIPTALHTLSRKFTARAKEQVARYVKDLTRREASEALIQVVAGCNQPIFISSMCANMVGKAAAQYDSEERHTYRLLEEFSESIPDDLAAIGDFQKVRAVYEKAVSEKEILLAEKAKSFLPTSKEEIRAFLTTVQEREERHLAILKNSDLQQLAAQKSNSERQINLVKSDISAIVGETALAVESKKAGTIAEIRKVSGDFSRIQDRTGARTESDSYEVSDSKWYNPFSWGKSHREYYSHQVSYSYLDVSDATENIHRYATTTVSQLESIFSETTNIPAMKRRLLTVIVDHFDTSNQNYDAAFFRQITEKSLNEIEFPILRLDFSDKQNQLTAKFSGEITSSSEKTSLNQMLSETVQKIFDEVVVMVEKEVRNYKGQLNAIAERLTASLLVNIQKEFEQLNQQFHDKELQMASISTYLECLASFRAF